MPNISVPLYATYIAHALKGKNGSRHIAVGFDNDGILGIGIDTRWHGHDPATATVNLLQSNFRNLPRNAFNIATTYPPTEACLGMANVLGARGLFCFHAGTHRVHRPQQAPPWPHQPVPGGLNQVDVQAMAGGFAAAVNKDLLAVAWYDSLENVPIHHVPRNFIAYADHLIVNRNVVLPVQIGVLPPLGAGLASMMTAQRRATLMMATQAMVAAVGFRDRRRMRGDGGHAAGHNIGCIIAAADGEIIEWGINQVNGNPSLHAETYAVMHWMQANGRQQLPAGCEMFTTLMSCYMCAGVISTGAPGISVHYAQDDPIMHNNSLARGINNSNEARFNFAQRDAINFVTQFNAVNRGPVRTTVALNATSGFAFMAEAAPEYKRLRYRLGGDELTVHAQGAGLINSICPNLV
jgi:tRNA(Arg) A34 adenosine deaminase TadA